MHTTSSTALLLRQQRPVREIVVRIVNPPGEDGNSAEPSRECKLVGRVAFALRELILAGERGLTAIQRPAYRWSDYIFRLRNLGIVVETIREPHGGDYPGSHARYRLASPLKVIEVVFAEGGRHAA